MAIVEKKIRIEVYRNGGEFAWNRVVSHVNTEIWYFDTMYCPYCGCKSVWVSYDNDNVFLNSLRICTSCKRTWVIIAVDMEDNDNLDRRNQRLEQLGKD